MESELLGIIRINVAAKNILLGSLGTQHQSVFAIMSFVWRNRQIFWTKLLHLSIFLVKQYTSLIYVKEISFCPVNWAFPFVGRQGRFLRSKVAKKIYAYEGYWRFH